jgi:hypothetical protein
VRRLLGPPASSSSSQAILNLDLPIHAAAINKHQTPPGGLEWHFARPSFRPSRAWPPDLLPVAASLTVQQTVPKRTKSTDAPPPHPDRISAVRPASSQQFESVDTNSNSRHGSALRLIFVLPQPSSNPEPGPCPTRRCCGLRFEQC